MSEAEYLTIKALSVIMMTSRTREYLRRNDPKAFEQAEKALRAASAGYQSYVETDFCPNK